MEVHLLYFLVCVHGFAKARASFVQRIIQLKVSCMLDTAQLLGLHSPQQPMAVTEPGGR